MEKPLISGESSSNGGRRREPHNRSDAIAHGSSYQKAAALVDLVRFILYFHFHCCNVNLQVFLPFLVLDYVMVHMLLLNTYFLSQYHNGFVFRISK